MVGIGKEGTSGNYRRRDFPAADLYLSPAASTPGPSSVGRSVGRARAVIIIRLLPSARYNALHCYVIRRGRRYPRDRSRAWVGTGFRSRAEFEISILNITERPRERPPVEKPPRHVLREQRAPRHLGFLPSTRRTTRPRDSHTRTAPSA